MKVSKSGPLQIARAILGRVALILFGLSTALLLAEIVLRFIPERILYPLVFKNEEGWRIYQVDENIGWVLRPNLNTTSRTDDGLIFKITTNSHGLRDTETAYPKAPGVYRILLLGDSFPEARQVDLADAFPSVLENCLNQHSSQPVEVINTGVSGYTLSDEYLFYQTEGVKYNPDLVLVTIYTGNDISELDRYESVMLQIAGAYRFELANGRLTRRWISWAKPDQPLSAPEQFLRQYSVLYKTLAHPHSKIKAYLERQFDPPVTAAPFYPPPPLPPWEYFVHAHDFLHNPKTPPILVELWPVYEALLDVLYQDTQTNGHKLAFVLIPNKQQADLAVREETIFELSKVYLEQETVAWDLDHQPNQTIIKALNRRGLPVLDLLPGFQAHDQTNDKMLYYDQDLHFNKAGHRLAANLLCQWLVDGQQVPIR
ncbi:MAG: hypothetical protein JW953_00755 [Anaerolineae bacterium]|nr:hypothetical protein [Anaerolineae bacterium]